MIERLPTRDLQQRQARPDLDAASAGGGSVRFRTWRSGAAAARG